MKLITDNKHYKIYNGSMLDMLEVIKPNSIDSIVCDPPYELGFMGRSWDKSGIAFQKEAWEKCLKVLKPGGYLLAFGGSRTFHRIAVAIEDAGFEIRDTIMWLYGSGFPKSMNISKGIEAKEKCGKANTKAKRVIEQECDGETYTIKAPNNGIMGEVKEWERKEYKPSTVLSKQWQGWGTALKPAYEPIIVARKPFKGSLVDNVMVNSVGGINIDECRVETEEFKGKIFKTKDFSNHSGSMMSFTTQKEKQNKTIEVEANALGRFPANVIHDGSEEVCEGFPDTTSRSIEGGQSVDWGFDDDAKYGYKVRMGGGFDDSGSASRYFYCAKASKKDRDEGLEINLQKVNDGRKTEIDNPFQRGETLRKNIHPTVKPVELMQYLVRLVSPKGATILDCFMGSGSTGKAVMFENRERNANYKFIGIDLTEEYCHIASARIDYALNKYEYDFKQELKEAEENGQLNLFDFI